MQWSDIYDIAMELDNKHPEANVVRIRFTDLKKMVLELPNFTGEPQDCNEKVLEAIQLAWIAERECSDLVR